MIRLFALSILIAPLCACAHQASAPAAHHTQRGEAAAARALAAQLCGPTNVLQEPGTDGTDRNDYYCGSIR